MTELELEQVIKKQMKSLIYDIQNFERQFGQNDFTKFAKRYSREGTSEATQVVIRDVKDYFDKSWDQLFYTLIDAPIPTIPEHFFRSINVMKNNMIETIKRWKEKWAKKHNKNTCIKMEEEFKKMKNKIQSFFDKCHKEMTTITHDYANALYFTLNKKISDAMKTPEIIEYEHEKELTEKLRKKKTNENDISKNVEQRIKKVVNDTIKNNSNLSKEAKKEATDKVKKIDKTIKKVEQKIKPELEKKEVEMKNREKKLKQAEKKVSEKIKNSSQRKPNESKSSSAKVPSIAKKLKNLFYKAIKFPYVIAACIVSYSIMYVTLRKAGKSVSIFNVVDVVREFTNLKFKTDVTKLLAIFVLVTFSYSFGFALIHTVAWLTRLVSKFISKVKGV